MHQQGAAKPPMSTAKKAGIAVTVLVCAPFVISGMIAGAKQNAASKPAAAAPSTPQPRSARPATATSRPAVPTTAAPAPAPTFVYPGDPQCAITYHDAGGGAMTWTVTTAVAGELITHAGGTDGTIYRHDDQVTEGPHPYRAPVPLARINDIGGNLRAADGSSYACSVAPQP